jgi:excisionase family DNA binding protein
MRAFSFPVTVSSSTGGNTVTVTNDEIIQAVFSATEEAKSRALAILQGEDLPTTGGALEEPLLLGMGQAAKLMGLSRATLWRLIKSGRLEKVEIYHNAFRLRRSDILALVQGRDGSPSRPHSSGLSSGCGPLPSEAPEVRHG